MKRIFLITFLWAFVSCVYMNAQGYDVPDSLSTTESLEISDSVIIEKSQSLSLSYYNTKNTLDREYGFELYNKQRRLRMWSNEVSILGYASFLGVCFGGPWLFPDASLWILIPVETTIGIGIIYGTNQWANKLEKKANALKETSVSLLNINKNSNLYAAHYSIGQNRNVGFGIGYKYNF